MKDYTDIYTNAIFDGAIDAIEFLYSDCDSIDQFEDEKEQILKAYDLAKKRIIEELDKIKNTWLEENKEEEEEEKVQDLYNYLYGEEWCEEV